MLKIKSLEFTTKSSDLFLTVKFDFDSFSNDLDLFDSFVSCLKDSVLFSNVEYSRNYKLVIKCPFKDFRNLLLSCFVDFYSSFELVEFV